ncbi:hypothetical protein [uncultured Mediterranean phage uvMED]|nr:hypothetical protein [uncultured Mediterranean phage uvMED]
MHERYKSLKKYVEHMNFWYQLNYGGDDKSDITNIRLDSKLLQMLYLKNLNLIYHRRICIAMVKFQMKKQTQSLKSFLLSVEASNGQDLVSTLNRS